MKQYVMLNNDIPSIYSDEKPWHDLRYAMSYQLFYDLSRQHDFPLFFCSPYDYNWEEGCLEGFWEPGESEYYPVIQKIEPVFIFDKAIGADPHCTAVIQQCEAKGLPIFGPPGLGRLCSDKWRIYQIFREYSPLTGLLSQNHDELVDDIYRFFDEMDNTYSEHANRAIVKPLTGFQSRGIHIISREPHGLEMHMLFGGQLHGADIERNLYSMSRVPYLIQAWVNTRGGIPGVGYEGEPHDVRFVFHIKEPGNAEFVMLYVKTLHGMEYVPLDEFDYSNPYEIVNPIADSIAEHFPYGMFSVDVMRDIDGNWFLTELNDQVGLSINFDNPVEINEMTRFMEIYLADMKRIYREHERNQSNR